MQIGRLFEIVYILLNKKKVTAKELSERFEVSVRTIYRDIDALSAAGIPVYTMQGTGGGIFLQEEYVLNKSLLTGGEQDRILLAVQSLSATGHLETGDLLSRLGNLFQKADTDWIEVDYSRWGDMDADRTKFELLSEAVTGHQVLTFHYTSSTGSVGKRVVSPVKLLFKSKAWYLQAFCHDRQDYRLFKLTRLSGAALTGEGFDKSALPPLPEPPPDQPPSHAPSVRVVVRFSPVVAYRLLDEFDVGDIQREPGGFSTVTMTFPDDAWIYGYILSFGRDAEVLEPPSVRERLLAIAENLVEKYSST